MVKTAKIAFLLLVFSLPFMKHGVEIAGLAVTSTDLLFLVAAAALGIALIIGQARLRWDRLFPFLLIYFGAMLISVILAAEPARAAVKLASQAYLLALPVLGYALIDSADELRGVLRTWLAATAVVTAIGTATVVLFVLGSDRAILDYALHEFGTLPPGNYPRLEATFEYPAMLCNYLTVSLGILFVSRRLGWVGPVFFHCLLAGIAVTAAFSLTPGLGGIFLLIGTWLFFDLRHQRPTAAAAALMVGGGAALAFVLAATVTPMIHSTAPFLVEVAGLQHSLAPSVRVMTWIAAGQSVLDHPLFGSGVGVEAIAVTYVAPSGITHVLTDAHNVFLNIAMHYGLAGLGVIALVIAQVVRSIRPLDLHDGRLVRVGLGLAWLNAFAFQGLTGSYEDARHLWVLLGLLLASIRIEQVTGLKPELAARPGR